MTDILQVLDIIRKKRDIVLAEAAAVEREMAALRAAAPGAIKLCRDCGAVAVTGRRKYCNGCARIRNMAYYKRWAAAAPPRTKYWANYDQTRRPKRRRAVKRGT